MQVQFGVSRRLQPSHLIDDEGKVWLAKSAELRKRLYCLDYPGDLSHDVIRNLGFIGLTRSGADMHVLLHACNLAPCAAATLLYEASELDQSGKLVIEYAGEARPSEIVRNADAIVRLGEISDAAELSRRVQARHHDINGLSLRSPLRPMFDHWLLTKGRARPDDLKRLARESIENRFLIVRQDPDSRLTIEDCGPGFKAPDPRWLNVARGQHIDEQHDVIYFEWVAEEYRSTIMSGRPQLADIRAQLLWPGVGVHRVHHRRMLLPCVDAEGKRFLFLANSPLPVVDDFRLEVG